MKWADITWLKNLWRTWSRPTPLFFLSGDGVFLREAQPADWPEWATLREKSRLFLTPWEPTWAPNALNRATFARRLKRQETEIATGTAYSFLIFDQKTKALVGGITLSNIRRNVVQTGTIGYWMGEPFARRGYMTAAIRLVIRFAFDDLGLHRLEAACLPHNMASHALLNKVGFQEEGYARGYLSINGQWEDHCLFSLLCTDPLG